MPKSTSFLLAGLFLGATTFLVAPAAHAASPNCIGTGDMMSTSVPGTIPATQGTDCGQLNIGSIFEVDVTDYISALILQPNVSNAVGLVYQGLGNATFSNIQAIASGFIGATQFTDAAIGLFGSSALSASGVMSYSASDPGSSFSTNLGTVNPFRTVTSVTLQGGSPSSFVGIFAPVPAFVSSFKIRGTFSGGSDVSGNIFVGLASVPATTSGFTTTPLGVGQPSTPLPSASLSVLGATYQVVPGPLPLAGAAAAFGWSRSLRRRIKAAKAAETLV
jgi:hypothetical protein